MIRITHEQGIRYYRIGTCPDTNSKILKLYKKVVTFLCDGRLATLFLPHTVYS